MSLVAALLTKGVLRLTGDFLPATHGLIFGAGAVLFIIGDGFFTRLLTELNTVLRSTGFSVWQAERLHDVIAPFKSQAWIMWWVSQGLKTISATCAVLLQKQVGPSIAADIMVSAGYFALFVALGCTFWLVRNFRRVDRFRDDLALEEVSIKEKKRLHGELRGGQEHDFGSDATIKGYSKPPARLNEDSSS